MQTLCVACRHDIMYFSCRGNFYLYRLYYKGRLTYIGYTKSPEIRVKDHCKDKIFDYVHFYAAFETKEEAYAAETLAILSAAPPRNKLYNSY